MLRIDEAGWVEKEGPKYEPMDTICRPVALALCSSGIHTVCGDGVGERHNIMLGYEAIGEVVEMGSMVRDFKVNDQMIVPTITPDWSLVATQESYAIHFGVPLGGWKFSSIKDGVFAKLIHVNDVDDNLAHLPEGVSPEAGVTLSDMVATGLHGAKLANIEPGDVVAVIGIDPVGLMSVASASAFGAGHPFTVGSRPKCTEVAQEFDATDIINYREGGTVEQVMEATKGQGINRVIVTGGDPDTFRQVFDILKVDGRVANASYLEESKSIKISHESTMVSMGHKHFVGGLTPGGHNRMDRMANLVLAGRIHPEKMITRHFTRIEHVRDGVELMRAKLCDLIKPVILV